MIKLTDVILKKYPNYPVYKAGFFELLPMWNISYFFALMFALLGFVTLCFFIHVYSMTQLGVGAILLFTPLLIIMFAMKKVTQAKCPQCKKPIAQHEYHNADELGKLKPYYLDRCYICHACRIGIKNAIGQYQERDDE